MFTNRIRSIRFETRTNHAAVVHHFFRNESSTSRLIFCVSENNFRIYIFFSILPLARQDFRVGGDKEISAVTSFPSSLFFSSLARTI